MIDQAALSDDKLAETIVALEASLERKRSRNKIASYFPDDGPLRRELYTKHLEFFRLGKIHMERAFMAANRVGKTVVGAYEVTVHLTGEYPAWWDGRRFDRPTDWWAASDTSETTRDIVQLALLGPPGDHGTGIIPHRHILSVAPRRGVTDAVDLVRVRHVSGGISTLGFKAFEQGREKFQGTAKHGIWIDEESPADVYDECLVRLMTTNGLMLCTFTPLKGLSEIALRYLPHLAPAAEPAVEPW
jgi:phage terminase large subunit-like protein